MISRDASDPLSKLPGSLRLLTCRRHCYIPPVCIKWVCWLESQCHTMQCNAMQCKTQQIMLQH